MCFSPLGSWPQYSSKVNVKGGNGDCKVVYFGGFCPFESNYESQQVRYNVSLEKIEILNFLKSLL